MSTEQKPATPPPNAAHATEPKQEPNALATWLGTAWTRFKTGQLLSYTTMAVILLVLGGIGLTWWILASRSSLNSTRWMELDGITSVNKLEEFAKANPDTHQAKLARLEIARLHLGPEGIDKMFVKATDVQAPTEQEAEKKARDMREAAVKNVETAREEFTKLADDFKDDLVIKVECMMALAKAEAVLVGIPKEGQLEQRRGDPAKAIEWLDKVTEAAPDTPWGKDSKKLADTLRNQNTQQQVATLHASLFISAPAFPPIGPTPPIAP